MHSASKIVFLGHIFNPPITRKPTFAYARALLRSDSISSKRQGKCRNNAFLQETKIIAINYKDTTAQLLRNSNARLLSP